MTNQNSKNADNKNSLFDDSFFDDDDDEEEDDDFDFDEDESEDENNGNNGLPVQAQAAVINPVSQNKISAAETSKISTSSEQSIEPNITQEIQFRLGCELGQILIPYENLQNLNIGSVVDFNNTLQTLYLSVNNIRVGEGMLVDVDGKIGIKITRWYGKV